MWSIAALWASTNLVGAGMWAKLTQKPFPAWAAYLFVFAIVLAASSLASRRFDFGLRLARNYEGGFWKRNAERIGLVLVGVVITEAIRWLAKILGA